MAFKHGKGSAFLIDDSGGTERNVSAYVTDTSLSLSVDLPTTTTYGASGVRRQVVGLKDVNFTITAQHDTTALTGSWTVFPGLVGAANTSTYKWGPEGTTAGLPRITGECRVESIDFSDPVDGVITMTVNCVGDDVATVDTF